MKIFLIAVEVILSAAIIAVVLMQPSKTDGLKGLMQGNSETFFSKNKSRTRESMLAKTTVILAVIYALVIIAINLLGVLNK